MKKPETSASLPLPLAPHPGQVIQLPVRQTRPSPPPGQGRQPRSLWYALYIPQLAGLPDTEQQRQLDELALLASQVSSSVSFHPQAVALEIRSSLRYFGGIDALHETLARRVRELLASRGLAGQFHYAASPTVTGSLLLARSGHNLLVYRRANLRSALGSLSTDVLELDREQRRRLSNMGVRRLRDLWRLPAAGLRKRFGSPFVNQLLKALGERPEPLQHYQPPPAFSCDYDLPWEVENLALLLPVVDEFLAQLVDFLRRRDLSVSRLRLSLRHDKQAPTGVTLGLRQPGRCRHQLLQLLEMHLGKLTLPAPVVAIGMEVLRFDAHLGQSGQLLNYGDTAPAGERDARLDRFMEQLRARVGDEHLKCLTAVAEHCPEYACQHPDPYHQPAASVRQPSSTDNPRPFWLLPDPQPLTVRYGKLYHHRPLRILSGPERIETRWWSGNDVRRDYYVALEEGGSRLWIYREKTGSRGWYLHGVFA